MKILAHLIMVRLVSCSMVRYFIRLTPPKPACLNCFRQRGWRGLDFLNRIQLHLGEIRISAANMILPMSIFFDSSLFFQNRPNCRIMAPERT